MCPISHPHHGQELSFQGYSGSCWPRGGPLSHLGGLGFYFHLSSFILIPFSQMTISTEEILLFPNTAPASFLHTTDHHSYSLPIYYLSPKLDLS